MHKKCIAITIGAVIIIGVGMFYTGMQYNKNKAVSQALLRGGNNTAGFQGGNRQGGGQRTPGNANNVSGDFVAGDIISKDDKSITVKTRDGGSKIIYFSDSTTVGKSTQGAASDLDTGEQVMANGTSNPDGSIAAQNIQIRPAQQN